LVLDGFTLFMSVRVAFCMFYFKILCLTISSTITAVSTHTVCVISDVIYRVKKAIVDDGNNKFS